MKSKLMDEASCHIPAHCSDCYHGRYELVVRDYPLDKSNGETVILHRIHFFRCVECGFEVLTGESNDFIVSHL